MPILGRDEVYNEYEKALDWKQANADKIGNLSADWLPRDFNGLDVVQKLFVPYVANWSFGERIPVIEEPREISHPASISAAYGRISSFLASGLIWSELESNAGGTERLQDKARINELESRQEEPGLKLRAAIGTRE